MKSIFISIFSLVFICNVYSQTIIVSCDSLRDYATIQEAINAAKPGSIVRVEEGTYQGPIFMKEGVSLEGINNPVIDGNNKGHVVSMASNTYISGFIIVHSGSEAGVNDCGILARNVVNATILFNEISNNGHYGIILDHAQCNVHYNQINSNAILGIYISDSSDFNIGFNTIQFHKHAAINIVGKNANGDIYNNVLAHNHNGIIVGTSQPIFPETTIYNNIIYSNNKGINAPYGYFKLVSFNSFYMNGTNYFDWNNYKEVKPNNSNIFKDPLLDISDVNCIHLTKKSPCINKGSNGNDIGTYKFDNGKEKNYAQTAKWNKISSPWFIVLEGTALNITADSTRSDFSGIVYSNDGIHFKFRGQYDNIHLFGYVEMTGVMESQQPNVPIEIKFNEGTVFLGNDNSGYPHGFSIPHTGSIKITDGHAEGTYKCGASLPFLNKDQYGIYELSIKRISETMKR